ncbi:MAG: lipopolysaccharide biosynthesis protein [Panacagrimonas sp.]
MATEDALLELLRRPIDVCRAGKFDKGAMGFRQLPEDLLSIAGTHRAAGSLGDVHRRDCSCGDLSALTSRSRSADAVFTFPVPSQNLLDPMVPHLSRGVLAKLFGSSIIGQAVLSGASLLVSLVLIRNTSSTEYGYFVLAQVAIQLLIASQDAWVGGPLTVLTPKREATEAMAVLSDVQKDHHRWSWILLPVSLCFAPLGFLLGKLDRHEAIIASITCLALWAVARREYMRTVLVVNRRQPNLLAVDLTHVTVMLTVVGTAAWMGSASTPLAVLAIALASVSSYIFARSIVFRMPGWGAPLSAEQRRDFWALGRPLGNWALFGAAVYWLYAQGYNNMVALKIDAAAVGVLAASRLLMTPLLLMTQGMRGVLIPLAAAWLRRDGSYPVIRRIFPIMIGVLLAGSAYLSIVWLSRDWVFAEVLRKVLPHRDTLLLSWGAIILLGVVRDFVQLVLLAMEQFKPLAGLSVLCAGAALSTMWFALDHMGLIGALLGIAVAEVVSVIGSLVLLMLAARKHRLPTG